MLTSSSSFGAENPNSRRRESSQTRSICRTRLGYVARPTELIGVRQKAIRITSPYGMIKYQNLNRGHVGSVLLQSAARVITSQISPICAAARAHI